jgi:MerR family redox-sensitive transcriptional activator SoxR
MEALGIGEVARQAGVRPSAIRYYESIGLLPPPARVSGRRRYTSAAVQMLAVIQLAQQAGFTMAEIGELFHGFSEQTPAGERWHQLAARKLHDVERMLQRAQAMKQLLESLLECGCVRLEDCVQQGE